MAVRSDDGLADRVRCGKYEYKCREPKTGQQKIQLYYDEDPLCPSSYITVLSMLQIIYIHGQPLSPKTCLLFYLFSKNYNNLTLIPLAPVCIIYDAHNGAHMEGLGVFHLYRN